MPDLCLVLSECVKKRPALLWVLAVAFSPARELPFDVSLQVYSADVSGFKDMFEQAFFFLENRKCLINNERT